MLPFPSLDTTVITDEEDAIPRCRHFRGFVSFCFLQSDDVTTLCSIDSQDTVNVVDPIDPFGQLLYTR